MKPFSIINSRAKVPLIVNIPHSSVFIPPSISKSFLLSEREIKNEKRLLTDWYTDELFAPFSKLGASAVIFGLSKIAIDPDRYESDDLEIMSNVGMGVIYTKGCDGRRLRMPPDAKEREQLLKKYYFPYHQALEKLCRSHIEKFGRVLIVDGRSYPENRLPYELGRVGMRPDICVGADPHHTTQALIDVICSNALKFDYSLGLNIPFSGSYVPASMYRQQEVHSVMIDINRRIYMNETRTAKKKRDFATLTTFVSDVAKSMIDLLMD